MIRFDSMPRPNTRLAQNGTPTEVELQRRRNSWQSAQSESRARWRGHPDGPRMHQWAEILPRTAVAREILRSA